MSRKNPITGLCRDHFIQAKRILDECGWVQGSYGGPNDGYCLAGALCEASYEIGVLSPAETMYMATDVIPDVRVTERQISLIAWNDEPGRTIDEVMAVLGAAIEGTEL